MTELEVGDLITCKDKDELFKLNASLNEHGIETEFCYERDGQRGCWLEVTGIEPQEGGAHDDIRECGGGFKDSICNLQGSKRGQR